MFGILKTHTHANSAGIACSCTVWSLNTRRLEEVASVHQLVSCFTQMNFSAKAAHVIITGWRPVVNYIILLFVKNYFSMLFYGYNRHDPWSIPGMVVHTNLVALTRLNKFELRKKSIEKSHFFHKTFFFRLLYLLHNVGLIWWNPPQLFVGWWLLTIENSIIRLFQCSSNEEETKQVSHYFLPSIVSTTILSV